MGEAPAAGDAGPAGIGAAADTICTAAHATISAATALDYWAASTRESITVLAANTFTSASTAYAVANQVFPATSVTHTIPIAATKHQTGGAKIGYETSSPPAATQNAAYPFTGHAAAFISIFIIHATAIVSAAAISIWTAPGYKCIGLSSLPNDRTGSRRPSKLVLALPLPAVLVSATVPFLSSADSCPDRLPALSTRRSQ